MTLFRRLFTALLMTGSFLCGGSCLLYAQEPSRSLPLPDNIEESTVFDESDGTFSIGYKLGDDYLDVPTVMTPDECRRYDYWIKTQK